jgi:hypothetical protein
MSESSSISPREEALQAILDVRESVGGPRLDITTWERVIELAWDHRTHDGDRREVQRELRQILLQASRGVEETSATP